MIVGHLPDIVHILTIYNVINGKYSVKNVPKKKNIQQVFLEMDHTKIIL